MEKLSITKENALKAYDEASNKGKELLTNLFGEEVFSRNIMDRVKSYDDACKILNINPDMFSVGVPIGCIKDMDSIKAYTQLIIIVRALNEGWEPDWSNSNQVKYYPWFEMKAGSGLSFLGYTISYTSTLVGSRLCFKTRELAEYAGKQFENIYRAYLTL